MREYRSKPQPSLASCCVSLGSGETRQKPDGLKQRTEIGATDRQGEGAAKEYSSCALVLCRHVPAIPSVRWRAPTVLVRTYESGCKELLLPKTMFRDTDGLNGNRRKCERFGANNGWKSRSGTHRVELEEFLGFLLPRHTGGNPQGKLGKKRDRVKRVKCGGGQFSGHRGLQYSQDIC